MLKVSAVDPAGFRPWENKALREKRHINPAYEVKHGDLLITRANTPELVGQACLVSSPPKRLLLCDKTLRLRVSGRDDVRFVFYSLQHPSVRSQIEIAATGSSGSMKNIGQGSIRALKMPRPSRAEQVRIAELLGGLDTTLAHQQQSLAKAQALRIGLGYALLTGRKRIADAAARFGSEASV